MARWLTVAICTLFLGACAGVSDYTPYIVDITDLAALTRDKSACMGYAEAYRPGLDIGAIANSTGQGVASNAAEAIASPWAPVLGGLGSGGATALNQIGLLSQTKLRVYILCLAHRGQKNGAYNVVDPIL